MDRLEKALARGRAYLKEATQKSAFQGIPVVVDRPKGFVQTGTDADGVAWERTYTHDYGYVPGARGGDAEDLDVFLGDVPDAEDAYWIVQQKADETFDEYKLMLGFASADDAVSVYLAHVPQKFFRAVVPMSIEMVKALLGLEPVEVFKALGLVADVVTRGSAALPHKPSVKQREVRIVAKGANDEQRYILGVVLEPDVVDLQGDTYDAETIRVAAWRYMADFQNIGVQHSKALANGRVRLVESYVTPTDMNIDGAEVRAGTWMLGVHVVDDALWADVRAGKFGGFSIGGIASVSSV